MFGAACAGPSVLSEIEETFNKNIILRRVKMAACVLLVCASVARIIFIFKK